MSTLTSRGSRQASESGTGATPEKTSPSPSPSPGSSPTVSVSSSSSMASSSVSQQAPLLVRLRNINAANVKQTTTEALSYSRQALRDTYANTSDIVASNVAFTSGRGLARMAGGGAVIGAVAMLGLMLMLTTTTAMTFGLYLMVLSLFHALEFALTALFHPNDLTFDSFLLNHSRDYHIAVVASVVEYWLERLLWPSLKQHTFLMLFGMCVCNAGQALRTVSMYTAGANFTHIVADDRQKHDGHTLVTTGVYAWSRHPSYVGWFFWSVGTQLMLCNPVCVCAYTYASVRFFRARVAHEEEALLRFFPDQYPEYKKTVPTMIPFVP